MNLKMRVMKLMKKNCLFVHCDHHHVLLRPRGVKALARDPYMLKFIPDHLKAQEVCEGAVEKDSWVLKFVSDHLKTQEMC